MHSYIAVTRSYILRLSIYFSCGQDTGSDGANWHRIRLRMCGTEITRVTEWLIS